jgi:hypothetical protein
MQNELPFDKFVLNRNDPLGIEYPFKKYFVMSVDTLTFAQLIYRSS